MTSSINFTDIEQKIQLLKELHAKEETQSASQRERYIQLRKEVARKLCPMFKDLENMDMLFYYDIARDETDLLHATNNGGCLLMFKK